jgi:hypothetical protein
MSSSLAHLFLASCRAVARRLQDAELPCTMEVEHTIVERQDPGGWCTAGRAETHNVLTDWTLVLRGAPWLTRDEVAAADRCSEMIARTARKTLPFFAPFSGREWPLTESVAQHRPQAPDYEHDPVGWVAQFIVLPALQRHLEALPSVERADETAAVAFAEEVLRVAHDDRLRSRVLVLLSGIDLDADPAVLTEGDIRIRRLSDAEQGQWLEEHKGSSAFSLLDAEPPRVALELSVSGARDTQQLGIGAGDRASLLVAALQLHGHQVAGRFALEQSDPVWVFTGSMGRPLTLPARSEKLSVLTASDLREVVQIARLLERYNLEQPQSPQDLALHRFVAGVARQNATDAVLDFTIALEALLLPYDLNARRGDLGYRFRIHGAYYLAEQPGHRHAIAKQLSAIYEMRSRLVHGGNYPDQAQIISIRETACGLARCGLLRAVRRGFPTAATFNSMVLGTGIP